MPAFDSMILKLASRCNLDCPYCYWFRDETVYAAPKLLPVEVEDLCIARLEDHLAEYGLDRFSVIFHGGEPLLFGKKRFVALGLKLRELEERSGAELVLQVTTNGVLIDAEWAEILSALRVSVAVSLDGPAVVHDRHRVDHAGRGTYERVVAGLRSLQAAGLRPGLLAVCDPAGDPGELCRLFVDELGVEEFDALVPDASHEDRPASVAAYYTRLFDVWYDDYYPRGVSISYLENIVRGLRNEGSRVDSIGFGPVGTLTVTTEGALEPLDTLRVAGTGFTATGLNVRTHDLQSLQADPLWQEAWHASLHLAEVCEACPLRVPCGGGHLPHRWSRSKRFQNPSVYCDDLKQIFAHVRGRLAGASGGDPAPGQPARAS
jgi:uncharacterized protein